MQYRRVVEASVLARGVSGPVVVAAFEDENVAYKAGNYATALRLVRSLADQGDASAQSNLGLMYRDGLGVPQDYVTAHIRFNLAAVGLLGSATEICQTAIANRDAALGLQ